MLENKCELQAEIRRRLILLMKRKSYSYTSLSKEIEINWRTLVSFLEDNKDVRIQPLMKIVSFVEKKEEEIKANKNEI